MHFNVETQINAMTFDQTGNYFYFVDGNIRKVVNVKNRTIFSTLPLTKTINYLAASPKTDQEDITVGISSNGHMEIYDDYKKLAEYSSGSVSSLAFCGGSENILVAFNPTYYYFDFWKVDYKYFDEWDIVGDYPSSYRSVSKIDCKN